MLRISQPAFLGREVEYVTDALERRALSMGKYVAQFEALLAREHNAQHAVATASGTSALHLALLALGLKPGQKVVVPACSYIATANAVCYCGAEPVFVDVRPDTWVLDAEHAKAVAVATEAVGIVTVHLYGVPAEVPVIPGLWTLEDSCEAHGLPLTGDAAVLSFYGNKIATCGEGGAVITNEAGVAERVRLLRGQGTTGRRRYVHEEVGFNYRLTELQAAVGCAQIETLRSHLRRRLKLRAVYDAHLPLTVLQQGRLGGPDWVVPVLVPNRDAVALALESAGVETRPVFPALHKQPPYEGSEPRERHADGTVWVNRYLPVAERLERDGLLLPLHLGMSEDDVKFVCESLANALREAAA